MYYKLRKQNRAIAWLLVLTMILMSMPMSAYAIENSITDTELEGKPQNSIVGNTSVQIEKENHSLEEDSVLRDKFSKHYVDPNGNRYVVVFPEQVHYLDNDSWIEIDNTFVLDETTKRYVSKNKHFRTQFSQVSDDSQLVTIEDGEYKLSWSISFATIAYNSGVEQNAVSLNKDASMQKITKVTARVSEINEAAGNVVKSKETISELGKAISGIQYNGVFTDHVDLRYSVLHGKVEEDVILNSPDGFTSYTLTIDTNGLSAVKREDNSVAFVTAEGEIIFTLAAPWMKDSHVSVSNDIEVTVQQNGTEASITYTPNSKWLNDVSRVYPVLIDPSFTTRFYTSNYVDTYVYTGDSASITRPAETSMMVGNISGNQYYAYVKILNIPDLVGGGGPTEATLHFWANTTSSPALSIYQVTGSWSPTEITYAMQPSSSLIKSNQVGEASGSVSKYSIDLTDWADFISYEYGFSNYFDSTNWNGFKIGYTTNLTGNYTEIYSSEYATASYRPVLTFQYDYTPYFGIENGSVYSFVNSASNKYLTVDGGNTANETNVYQYSKTNSQSQAFRLDYNETNDCYRIRAICSNNGHGSVLSVPNYNGTINNTSGYTNSNVCIFDRISSMANAQDWIIYPYQGGDLYRIVLRSDPNLALTAYGTANGTAGGTSSTSEGNVFVSQFTGASNQLWKLESGGIQLLNAPNIKDVEAAGESYSVYENSTWLAFCCPAREYGAIVTWSSSNTRSIDVDEVGRVTVGTAGLAVLYADIEYADGNYETYSCTIYVIIENGTYYFNDVSGGRRLEYENISDLSENAVLESYASGSTEPTGRFRMFKIKYLGSGLYSIRSMLDCTMGWTAVGTNLVMTTIGTSDNTVPIAARWRIKSDLYGYYVHAMLGPGKTVTAGNNNGVNITLDSHSSYEPLQHWTIQEITTTYHGVTLKRQTAKVGLDDTFDFDAVMYSTYTDVNGEDGFVWSVIDDTGSATIDEETGKLTGVTVGTVTVQAKYIPNNYQEWVAECTVNVIPIYEGFYFLSNAEYGQYMQIDDNASFSADDAFYELWNYDGASDQHFELVYLFNGYYKIVSVASNKAITAPSSLDNNIVQRNYSGLYTQQWKITKTIDGTYRICPRSNETYYMAAGDGVFAFGGRNIELRSESADMEDEWFLIGERDLRCIGIPDEGHEDCDHTSTFPTVKNNLNDLGFQSYEMYEYVKADTLCSIMAASKVVVINSHGFPTKLFMNDTTLTVSDVNKLPSNAFENLQLIVLVACKTGRGGEGANNLVNAIASKGAQVVIGFEEDIYCGESDVWVNAFFNALGDGETIMSALDTADNAVEKCGFESGITTNSHYTVGNTNQTILLT